MIFDKFQENVTYFKDNLEKILAIEQTFDVNSVQYKELTIWPLIRLHLKQRLYHSNFSCKSKQLDNKNSFLLPNNKTNEEIKKIEQTDIVFFSRSVEYNVKINGKYYNPFLNPIMELAKNQYEFVNLELISQNTKQTLPRYEETILLAPENQYIFEEQIESIENFKALKQIIHNITGLQIFEDYFINQAKGIKSWQYFFMSVLSELKPHTVFLVCYYYVIAMALVRACKILSIQTVDVQHGVNDEMYSPWTKIPPDGYDLIPDKFWCWGNFFYENINKWIIPENQHQAIVGGNLWIHKWNNTKIEEFGINHQTINFYSELSKKDKVILITMQTRDVKLPDNLLHVMKNTQEKLYWLIRLHPEFSTNQDKLQIKKLLEQHKIYNYDTEFATSSHLYGLFNYVDHLITFWSATVYDAIAFHIPATVIHPSGYQIFMKEISKEIVNYADTTEKLSSLLTKKNKVDMKQLNTSEYVMYDKQFSQNTLKYLMNTKTKAWDNKKINTDLRQNILDNQEFIHRSADTYNLLGETFFQKGFKQAAFNAFQKALSISKHRHALAYNNLGVCYWQVGQKEISLKYFFKALMINNNEKNIIINIRKLINILENSDAEDKFFFKNEYYKAKLVVTSKAVTGQKDNSRTDDCSH